MGKIIVFGSHKGGVGKSTLLVSILVCLHRAGYKCAVLECDDQNSIKDFLAERKEQGITPDFDYHECYTDIAERARKLASRYDFVLLDTPGKKSAEFRKALTCADTLLSFIEPGAQVEINTLSQMVNDVKTAQSSLNPSMQPWIVLNRCSTDPRDQDASELRQMLNDDPDWLPVTRQRIYLRKAYKQAYNTGRGVHEHQDNNGNKGRGEIELLLQEVGLI
ncbi:ParA family protein [Pantoea agglomerans]|uniref:ParA family protein n=1 Tax=Enterobacter agglomerans TaxID=549 RepID=UPI000DACA047|nr:ParA family protein [Pantoea agglomerans]RAH26342.1 peptidyl-arginine deiminase [Pantoea agglomerans]TGX88197.1 peptidyl-arginine deiminase [Pantoea agglomerans]